MNWFWSTNSPHAAFSMELVKVDQKVLYRKVHATQATVSPHFGVTVRASSVVQKSGRWTNSTVGKRR